LSIDDTMT